MFSCLNRPVNFYGMRGILIRFVIMSIGLVILPDSFAANAVVSNKSGEHPVVVDVTSYGANARSDKDDTAAFQAAFDAIRPFWEETTVNSSKLAVGKANRFSMNQPAVIVIPPGTYQISRTINAQFKNRLTVVATGVRIVWTGSVGDTLFDFRNSSFLNVQGLMVDGSRKLGRAMHFGVSSSAYGDYGNSNVTGLHLENITIKRLKPPTQDPMKRVPAIDTVGDISRSYLTSVQDSFFENVIIESDGDIGISIGTSEVRIVGGILAGQQESLRLYTGASLSVFGTTFTGGSGTHISIFKDANVAAIRFFGVYFEGYTDSLVEEIASGGGVRPLPVLLFDGCFFSNPAPEFINLPNRRGSVYLTGNQYYPSDKYGKFKVRVNPKSVISINEQYLDKAQPEIVSGQISRMMLVGSGLPSDSSCAKGQFVLNERAGQGDAFGWLCADTGKGDLHWKPVGR